MARRPQRPSTRSRASAKTGSPAAAGAAGSNKIRIIGGCWRGRKLEFADLPGLRPTTDRVRETLFNWLQTQLAGARCLDLFAGSGALGLEALSRGASSVTLIDSADAVVRQLRANLTLLTADDAEQKAEVIHAHADRWLQTVTAQPGFDLVFLDPPFGQGMLAQCCDTLEQRALLRPNGWIYIEAEKTLQPLPVPGHWRLHRSLNAGQVGCYLYQRCTDQ